MQDSYLLAKTISEYNFTTPNNSNIDAHFGENAVPLVLTNDDYNNCITLLTAKKFNEFKEYINNVFFNRVSNNSPVEITNNLYTIASACKNAFYALSKQIKIQANKQINTLQLLIKTSWKISEFKKKLFTILDEYEEVVNVALENSNLVRNAEISQTICRIVEEFIYLKKSKYYTFFN